MGQCGSTSTSKNQNGYNLESPSALQAQQYDAAIHQSSILGISSFEARIASCGDDNTIALSNVNHLVKNDQSIPPQVLKGHEKAVNRVIFHNKCLFSASRDLSLRIVSKSFHNFALLCNN